MVERSASLDRVFHALADATRRDILRRVCTDELSVSDLADAYNASFAAVAKHVAVLERAKLIRKRRAGKQQMVSVVPEALSVAQQHLQQYATMWQSRFENLDNLLNK